MASQHTEQQTQKRAMARETGMSQSLMSGALMHFQSGVPIKDLDMRREHKDRLARVAHVYWVWIKDPMLDVYQMLRQLVKQTGSYSDAAAVTVAAQKDKMLFDFVIDHIQSGSRRQDELKVRYAAERMITIGLETDNVMALDKGSKRLYEVAGLDKPESEQADLSKTQFIQPVVTTVASQVDSTKIDYTDEQSLLIMREFGAYIDPKREAINDKVAAMEARAGTAATESDEHKDETSEQ
jgi:uncharacterized protein YihD (DUF1040 family)